MSGANRPSPLHPTPGPGSKVAIPRLERRDDHRRGASSEKHRVAKACSNCRRRKVKCTGEVPRCKNCEEHGVACVYASSRKDRLKTATEQNVQLIQLLKDLRFSVNDRDRRRIQDLLERVGDDATPASTSLSPQNPARRRKRESSSDAGGGGAHVTGSVGSNEDVDLLDEDLLRSRESRATGFYGQNSEVQWLRSLKQKMERAEVGPYGLPNGPPGRSKKSVAKRTSALQEGRRLSKSDILHAANSTIYLDEDQIDEDMRVHPFELPPLQTAQRLLSCFMETVHPLFPIVPMKEFAESFEKKYLLLLGRRSDQVPDGREKWQATLNVIFAIGAKYSQLIGADRQADDRDRDHLVYHQRARSLGLKDSALLYPPDLALIHNTGLLSLYYLAIGHVSRAWVAIGISLRFALAVGLHLRNENPSADAVEKETLVRTWWGLYLLERLLSAMTGRPSVISDQDCSVPPPQALPEMQFFEDIVSSRLESSVSGGSHDVIPSPTTSSWEALSSSGLSSSSKATIKPATMGSFLEARIKISDLTQKVLSTLYSPQAAVHSWEFIQTNIASLNTEMDGWTLSLPVGFDFNNRNSDRSIERERLLLAFYYNSTKILTARPCLCRRIGNQSSYSDSFNQKTAEACIQSAKALTQLLPDPPNPVYIYSQGPWLSIVHYIMQALAVFLLELSYGSPHMHSDGREIRTYSKKLMRWLRAMKPNNAVAAKAYEVATDILKKGTIQLKADIDNLLAEDAADSDQGTSTQGKIYAEQAYGPAMGQTSYSTDFQGQYPMPFRDQPDGHHGFTDPFQHFSCPNQPATYGNQFMTTFDQHNPTSATSGNLYDIFGTGDATMPDYSEHQQNQDPYH